MLKNQETTGTFSTGALTAAQAPYTLNLSVSPGVSMIVDNLFVYRQDVTTSQTAPPTWERLVTMPFPRLGNKILEGSAAMAQYGWNEGPFSHTVAQLEDGLAFADLIVGLSSANQSLDPDSIHRVRALNPNVVILPVRDFSDQRIPSPPGGSNIVPDYQLLQSTPDQWKATDTFGNVIHPLNFPDLFYMNLSSFAPAVNGQTWRTALPNFVTSQIFSAGLWDGIWLANMQGTLDPDFPNGLDPALFNYDWNRNGLKDETPASTSDMIRSGTVGVLQQLNSSAAGLQLTMGNAGATPEFALAPLVNGYSFECFNTWWNRPGTPIANSLSAAWRTEFDAYLRMQGTSLPPQLNLLQACGVNASDLNNENRSTYYLTPTTDDLQKHRLSMGTALLGDGFYEYALKDDLSAPYWFDEYSVDASGNAIRDRAKKGYLGHPLSDAVELGNPGTLIFQENFESGTLPNSFIASPPGAATVTQTAGQVISGTGSLALNNPDHTRAGNATVTINPQAVSFSPGAYLLTFDWRVLETCDFTGGLGISVSGNSANLDRTFALGAVTGDSGTVDFPFTIPSAGTWSVQFAVLFGGGAVAIDNVKIYEGGAGPWRRDFENGFVLVNPFPQPHTFSMADLAGALNRTGIKRINGAQAPETNNGQPVTGGLTVGAFDAIILLADRIGVALPSVTSARTPGGFPDIAQNGWIEIKGSNLAPLGAGPGGMTWNKALSFQSGIMPTELGGVRVKVNGKPAFVYFVSSNQINVLAPLDNTIGPVQIVVTSGGVTGAPFLANLQFAAPSFPLVGSTKYAVATHADYSLVGPSSLSAPGYTFTPARAGETIILYAFGLGLPTTPLVNRAATQSGSLPVLPQVQIGGTTATVAFAGLISPGLYQLNVTIPGGVSSGDNKLALTYNGQASPSGDLISIQ
jgi:uncharacterized protein (TIGR03437 family)